MMNFGGIADVWAVLIRHGLTLEAIFVKSIRYKNGEGTGD
jgi:hypothetical protein